MLLVSTVVFAGDLEDGIEDFERYDYATALAKLKPLAKQGDTGAQNNLGLLYDDGEGVPRVILLLILVSSLGCFGWRRYRKLLVT